MTNEEIINFGKNIKSIRKQRGVTQKEFAEECDIGVYSLRLIEKGVLPERLSVDFLINVYRNYGVPPSEIFSNCIKID